MASTQAICSSFKQQLMLSDQHDFTLSTGDAFYWALYTSTATHSAATTVYTNTNELPTAGFYTQAGLTLANVTPTIDGTTAITDWADPTWTTATFTAASTLLYNNTHATDAAVAVWDFGTDQTASGGSFVLELPIYAAATAILRLA